MIALRRLLLSSIALLLAGAALAQDAGNVRILLPISVSDVPGAYGTLWSTELWYRNNGDVPVPVFPLAVTDAVFPVHTTLLLQPGSFPATSPGRILFMQSEGAENVQFDLRLFNHAERSDSWGAQIPVVRESEFRNELTLINIPTSPEFRSALRVYGLPEELSGQGTIQIDITSNTNELLASTTMTVGGVIPLYAQFLSLADEFPEIRAADRVNVHVQSLSEGVKLWAFVAVVSNSTQEVSIIAPN